MKIIAILSGGDWADASVDILDVPDNVDVDAEHDKYMRARPRTSFTEWLAGLGARDSDRVEIFDNT